jgi:Fe-S cluster biogenesis protein NfuA
VRGDIETIKRIIQEVKPSYTAFGGDVEFVDIQEGKVRVRPSGFCHR